MSRLAWQTKDQQQVLMNAVNQPKDYDDPGHEKHIVIKLYVGQHSVDFTYALIWGSR